mgnify:CR=1 FL=1|tara:strand:- start:6 stop:218 length:213 start_codon:yes stop_codon:yes gene_type:complete
MIDLIINFGIRVLDFSLEILLIIFTLIFSVLQPALWVIIPLFILNKLTNYYFDISLLEIIKKPKIKRGKK